MYKEKTLRGILIFVLLGIGLVTNLGTAALRINRLLPLPKIVDFGSYYCSALALRMKESPYPLSQEFLSRIKSERDLYLPVPVLHSPPAWMALLIPLTGLKFPIAAWLWMLFLIACLLYSTNLIIQIANPVFKSIPLRKKILPYFVIASIVMTFGPSFLSLTLGQNSILILVACLVMGRYLDSDARSRLTPSFWIAVATLAKIYPLLWLASLAVLRVWKPIIISIVVVIILSSAVALYRPDVTVSYWNTFIFTTASQLKQDVFIDDQSLRSFLARMFQSRTYGFATLDAEQRATVTWSPSLTLSDTWVSAVAYFVLAILSGMSLLAVLLARKENDEGGFYLLVLISLLWFPHMERYNHVLLLPAMAWLWKRQGQGRIIAIISYMLVGLSRLTHFWVMHLGYPIAALATGLSLFALLLLAAAITKNLLGVRQQSSLCI
ncbi:MAG: glycosyltransferase family 87 protein [bacterium]